MSAGVAAWMTTNVIRSERGDYVWRFDLSGVGRLIADYFARDDWGLVSRWPEGAELHFIVAGRGGRFTDAEVARLQSLAHVQTTVFAESGHWVHVDAPELLRAHLISS